MNDNWMADPLLSQISPEKIEMLQQFAARGKNMDQNHLVQFLTEASSCFRQQGLSFTPRETQLIYQAVTAGKSQEEKNRIRKMMYLLKMLYH